MAGYATLQEAYNIESFTTKKKKNVESFKNKEKIQEKFMNDYSSQDECYFKKEFGINNDTCKAEMINNPNYGNFVANEGFTNNSTDVKDYKSNTMNTQGGSCSPLQAPSYNLPMSEENKAEFKKVVDLYTNYQSNNITYNEFNKNKESNDIMPYYDEDMDQYLDINTLKTSQIFTGTSGSEIIPNNKRYMPNYNEKGYTDDNTDKYLNINTKTDDILIAPSYNLSEEDKKNSLRSLNILKKFSDNKIDGTGITPKSEAKYETVNNYDTFYNIALFIFIGIVIILLCDQITELAINMGMKRATEILEPYLNKPNNIITKEISNMDSLSNVIEEAPVLSTLPGIPGISNNQDVTIPELSIIDIYKKANVK
jgi:hypothetical protein